MESTVNETDNCSTVLERNSNWVKRDPKAFFHDEETCTSRCYFYL